MLITHPYNLQNYSGQKSKLSWNDAKARVNLSLSLSLYLSKAVMPIDNNVFVFVKKDKGRCKKKRFFLGLCPKHQTPPTHHARLGLH